MVVITKVNLLFESKMLLLDTNTLKVATPTASAFLFFGFRDACLVEEFCGYDVELIKYVATWMNKKIR
jgi:hypothetical protein